MMNEYRFDLAGTSLVALPSGALWWPERRCLTVSDLHLGKSARLARAGVLLPPYETQETLSRLETDLAATGADKVVCLGDSFDDLAAAGELGEDTRLWITRLQAGRSWTWIEGNHDPGPVDFPGSHVAELRLEPLRFRHIAIPEENAEISGHYHPKTTLPARGRGITRPCFLIDRTRVIMPAYGTFTGGLRGSHPALSELLAKDALAVLTGPSLVVVPFAACR